jgi:hypothetical protein
MARPPALNPLTDEHLAIVNRALQVCSDVDELLNACDGCEILTAEARQRIADQRKFCQSVKREFFPNAV